MAPPAANLSTFNDPVFQLRLANTAPNKTPAVQLPLTLQISQLAVNCFTNGFILYNSSAFIIYLSCIYYLFIHLFYSAF